MNRIEEVLLDRMTVRRWCVVVLVAMIGAGAAGYFGGRQQLRHEIAQQTQATMTAATQQLESTGKRWSDEINAKQAAIDAQIKQKVQRQGGGR